MFRLLTSADEAQNVLSLITLSLPSQLKQYPQCKSIRQAAIWVDFSTFLHDPVDGFTEYIASPMLSVVKTVVDALKCMREAG